METDNLAGTIMMHIILILPDLVPGGAQRIFIDLAESLSRAGYRTTAIVVYPSQNAWSFGVATKVIYLSDSEYGFYSRLMLPIQLLRLRSQLIMERPDAVISTLTGMNIFTLLATWSGPGNYPVLIREASTASNRTSIFIRTLKKLLYPKASAIVAVSEGVSNDLISDIGLTKSRLHVINNPVNRTYVQQASVINIAHKWLINKSVPVFISVGRLTRAKDYVTLIQALKIVRQTLPAKLIIVGEGPERLSLERLVHSMGLNNAVDMPGHYDNPYSFMARADVFVLSSRWEGFVNVLLEALALGMPIVSTDCHSSPREILQNGKYGRLVPPGDPSGLAENMLNILKSTPKPEFQKSRAAEFSPEILFERYRILINKLSSAQTLPDKSV